MNQRLWNCWKLVVSTFFCLNISYLSAAAGAPIKISGLKVSKPGETFFGKLKDSLPNNLYFITYSFSLSLTQLESSSCAVEFESVDGQTVQ